MKNIILWPVYINQNQGVNKLNGAGWFWVLGKGRGSNLWRYARQGPEATLYTTEVLPRSVAYKHSTNLTVHT